MGLLGRNLFWAAPGAHPPGGRGCFGFWGANKFHRSRASRRSSLGEGLWVSREIRHHDRGGPVPQEPCRTRTLVKGPKSSTSAAELFFLQHVRSCAASARGAQRPSGKPCGSAAPAGKASAAQAWVGRCLGVAYVGTRVGGDLALEALLVAVCPSVWLPAVASSCLVSWSGMPWGGGRPLPPRQVARCLSWPPVPFSPPGLLGVLGWGLWGCLLGGWAFTGLWLSVGLPASSWGPPRFKTGRGARTWR